MKTAKLVGVVIALGSICAMPALAADSSFDRRDRPNTELRSANNSFYVEAGGPGLLYSLNYERLVENDFGLRVGLSYTSFSASASSGGSTATASAAFWTFPVTVSYLGISSGNHALELGAGGTAIYASGAASGTGIAASGSGMAFLGTAVVGYRRQPMNGGFQFRIGLEALMGKGLALSNPNPDNFGVLPWLYMSVGFSL
jgi:hypothetical protein